MKSSNKVTCAATIVFVDIDGPEQTWKILNKYLTCNWV